MKIQIHIHANNDLLCHEALSLAFALTSFDHEISICLGRYLCQRMNDGHDKFINMLKSLPLYDIHAVYEHSAALTANTLDKMNQLGISANTADLTDVDSVFYL